MAEPGRHGRQVDRLDQAPAQGTRFTVPNAGQMYRDRYWHQREFEAVGAFQQIATEAGMKPATLAVAWVLQQPAVTAPIIGASKMEHLDDAVAALDVKLGDDDVKRLEEPYRPHPILGHS